MDGNLKSITSVAQLEVVVFRLDIQLTRLCIHILKQKATETKVTSPRYSIPETFASSFRNSTAIESQAGAGEKVKIPWIPLVASTFEH